MKQYPKASHFKAQKLPYPAKESALVPTPQTEGEHYKPAGKLQGKIALLTGADSGIGRSAAIAFCKEGARVAIVYNENTDDAKETKRLCEKWGGDCLVIQADVRKKKDCEAAVQKTIEAYGHLNILVNNASYQMAATDFMDITEEQMRRTFDTNIIAYMLMAQAALPHLKQGDSIINTGSIVGKTGHPILIDYTASKAAIHTFTKSLSLHLGDKGIRVNCVVPGPVWTPNIPATMPESEVENFGHEVSMKRPGQPEELAPAYVFLACDDASFITGSLIDVTGGKLSGDA